MRTSRAVVPLALAVLLAVPAWGSPITVSISPANPTEIDPIDIRVDGLLEDTCWFLNTIRCGEQTAADTLKIETLLVHEGYGCQAFAIAYAVICPFGPLPPGHYTVIATQYARDHGILLAPEAATAEIVVTALTAAGWTSWGRVKALYR